MAMPKYFINVQAGDELFEDEDGLDLSGPDQARSAAIVSGREMWANACKTGQELKAEIFVIADENGHSVMSIALADALPKGLKRA
jgi:Domain of unknown function (DUF6894)